MSDFDVIVIGGGPGGYVAAIRCAQLGMKTACIDNWLNEEGKQTLGGTCLNAGCIPSKALLESSEYYADLMDTSVHPGINLQGIELDLKEIQHDKNKIVSELTGGIQALFRANGVASISGQAQRQTDKQIIVTSAKNDKKRDLLASNIIIATGSRPMDIAAAKMDQHRIVDSQAALQFDEIPEHLGIIGAGVIGLEMGSVWQRFGSEVTILEAQECFLPAADREVAALALAEYRRQGLTIHTGACVKKTHNNGAGVTVDYKSRTEERRVGTECRPVT